ncbi:hypothetical protein SO802_033231, partial [Lithocarpus litseifolius]
MNTLQNLPNDILVEIFSKAGNDLATLLGNIKLSCKSFNKLTEKKLVFQKIRLTPYFNHRALLDDKAKKLIFSCNEAKNPHALLIVGTYKYFLNEEVVEGKRLIEEALGCGDFIATYIHGVMLLCESNPKGIIN